MEDSSYSLHERLSSLTEYSVARRRGIIPCCDASKINPRMTDAPPILTDSLDGFEAGTSVTGIQIAATDLRTSGPGQ